MAHLLFLRGAIGAGKSCVAKTIACSRPTTKVLEVDDIKILRYGTPEHCEDEDFRRAGRWARYYLDRGIDVVLVEPFCEEEDLTSALDQVARSLDADDVTIVWLDCGLETSLARKGSTLGANVIRWQHERYPGRCRPPGERVIPTEGRTVAEVAEEVGRLLPTAGLDGSD